MHKWQLGALVSLASIFLGVELFAYQTLSSNNTGEAPVHLIAFGVGSMAYIYFFLRKA